MTRPRLSGLRRLLFAAAAAALRWLARGETNAAAHLTSWSAWCEAHAVPAGEGDPRAPQPP